MRVRGQQDMGRALGKGQCHALLAARVIAARRHDVPGRNGTHAPPIYVIYTFAHGPYLHLPVTRPITCFWAVFAGMSDLLSTISIAPYYTIPGLRSNIVQWVWRVGRRKASTVLSNPCARAFLSASGSKAPNYGTSFPTSILLHTRNAGSCIPQFSSSASLHNAV